MCGIAGFVNFYGINRSNIKQVKDITLALSHRGPDAEGLYHDNFVVLGHKRLSIIDLSSISNQPMKDSTGQVFIVFNGEIYNHMEIRKDLEKDYIFQTDHSDTETIIIAYRKWGIRSVELFNGMFAFAIYDRREKAVYIVRDRLGKKPLYYVSNGSELYFSSEIQAFFSADVIKKKLNIEAIYHYLTMLTVNAPNTFFNNVNKLEAGYYLKITPNYISKTQYWNVSDYINQCSNDDFVTACNKSHAMIEKSMYYRNISDVPISIALSGGIDSSLNLYYSKRLNSNISAVNISYTQHSKYDESNTAKKLCNDLDVKLICKKVNAFEFENCIKEYIEKHIDMPVGDPNNILVYIISQIVRKSGTKVLIVGEGGDEIGGYPVYRRLQNEYNVINFFAPIFFHMIEFLPKVIQRKLDFHFNKQLISKRHIHGFLEYDKKQFWKGPEFNSYKLLQRYMQEIRDDLSDSFLRKVLNIEYKIRLPELILARIDYPTMSNSVEARSPFMDYKLIEYSSMLPFSKKMKYGSKTIIKTISNDLLPSYIMQQPKIGFGMLLTPFFKYTMPKWFKSDFEKQTPLYEFIKKSFLNDLYCYHRKKYNMGYQMWVLYSLNKWMLKNF